MVLSERNKLASALLGTWLKVTVVTVAPLPIQKVILITFRQQTSL